MICLKLLSIKVQFVSTFIIDDIQCKNILKLSALFDCENVIGQESRVFSRKQLRLSIEQISSTRVQSTCVALIMVPRR